MNRVLSCPNGKLYLVLRPDYRNSNTDNVQLVDLYTVVRVMGDCEPGCPILEISADIPDAPGTDCILVGQVEFYGGHSLLWFWDDKLWTPMILDEEELEEE